MPLMDTIPRPPWEPPPPPPSRYEMIDYLEKHNLLNVFGPIEDFDQMTAAELWERYRPVRDEKLRAWRSLIN